MHKMLLGVFFLGLVVNAQGTELDPPMGSLPQEIIVREDAQGQREVFKVAEQVNVENETDAMAVAQAYVKDENKVENLVAKSELDRVTSTEAWYYWYYGWNWNYGYRYYNYNYYYRPYFTFSYGYYNYYYYRWW